MGSMTNKIYQSMKDRSAKVTKDGKLSIKLPEDEWLVLEQALRTRIGLVRNIETALWCLLEETLKILEARSKLTLKFRSSEFFTVFCQDTFQYVNYDTAILIESTFEQIRKNQVQALQSEPALRVSIGINNEFSER